MADALYTCPNCGGDCGSVCANFVTNDCVDAVELLESEICTMLYSCVDPDDPTQPLYKPADWKSTDDFKAAIAAGLNKVNVIGDIPEPTQESVTISKRRKKNGKKNFTANIDIDEWTEENYEAMRQWECGATVFVWFQTVGGITTGGENGMRVDITKANSPLTRGENQYAKILLVMEWSSKCSEPRTTQVELL